MTHFWGCYKDVLNEIYSNPLFDEEIISVKIDASIISMIDSLLEKFSGELAHNDLIPPGINEADFDLEEDIHFIERLFDSLREEIDIFPGPNDSIPPGIKSDDFDSEDDDNSTFLPEFESFHVDYPDSGDSTIDVVEDIPVDVPNILPTHPALHMDFDFIPFINDLGSDLNDSSPFGDRNKIYDPGICIEVKSTRFLATLSLVIDTLIPFSSENDDKVFNHGVLALKKKSPPSSSHRGLKASKLFHHKSPMLIHGDNTPILVFVIPIFIPLDKAQVWGDRVKLSDLKQALRGWQPMLIRSMIILVMNKCVVMMRLASTFPMFCLLWFIVQDFPDCDDSRARGFVLHSLEFHILSFNLGIPIS
ncbi:hypothetical protein Tco_0462233 [Tanacetum coccineum]